MSIRSWFGTPRVRRGLAASVVVLSVGGLVLFRAPGAARGGPSEHTWGASTPLPSGPNTVPFQGDGAHGSLSVSHTRVLAGGERRLFAELRLAADDASARERAPLSMVVVLDTSGSMDGDKIAQAKDSVLRLIAEMRDDDEIALVRYSSDSELVQPLARVGSVRAALGERIRSISASGGTNIAPALQHGLRALAEAGKGRVRRVVLVSDGLDSTRAQSESVARESAERGVTTSALGIGTDFDEGYMGSVAQRGHGNFGFVRDGSALAGFLDRELKEGATTVVEGATARIALPRGVRLVRALGAEATQRDGGVDLRLGSLFAGDERRVVLELATTLEPGETAALGGQVRWDRVGGGGSDVPLGRLEVAGTTSPAEVDASRDGAIYASVMSVVASTRQLEATQAYASGDVTRAQALIEQNVADLGVAAAAAPAPARAALERQQQEYDGARQGFATAAPTSTEGKSRAKAAAAKDVGNLARPAF